MKTEPRSLWGLSLHWSRPQESELRQSLFAIRPAPGPSTEMVIGPLDGPAKAKNDGS